MDIPWPASSQYSKTQAQKQEFSMLLSYQKAQNLGLHTNGSFWVYHVFAPRREIVEFRDLL